MFPTVVIGPWFDLPFFRVDVCDDVDCTVDVAIGGGSGFQAVCV